MPSAVAVQQEWGRGAAGVAVAVQQLVRPPPQTPGIGQLCACTLCKRLTTLDHTIAERGHLLHSEEGNRWGEGTGKAA